MRLEIDKDDAYLVAGLKRGDEKCFDALFLRYSAAIFKICRYYHLPKMEAEEVVQEVFIKIWENRSKLDNSLSFKSYLFTIAKNIILKGIRKNTLQIAFQKYVMGSKPSSENETENHILYQDLQQQSNSILEMLSPQRRQVFIMNRFEGLSCDEIAITMGISKRTVEHHLYHAQKFIREKMKVVAINVCILIQFLFL
jgi:RNA polymerase sigma-70 factor (family 1)